MSLIWNGNKDPEHITYQGHNLDKVMWQGKGMYSPVQVWPDIHIKDGYFNGSITLYTYKDESGRGSYMEASIYDADNNLLATKSSPYEDSYLDWDSRGIGQTTRYLKFSSSSSYPVDYKGDLNEGCRIEIKIKNIPGGAERTNFAIQNGVGELLTETVDEDLSWEYIIPMKQHRYGSIGSSGGSFGPWTNGKWPWPEPHTVGYSTKAIYGVLISFSD